jgi:glycosyltransferase involved in cell wall biosynthesis
MTSMNQPLVSVLTPVYNGEKFLAECIESVLAQDYQHWEYHIVNNCSTDGTLRIAQSYADKDPRIRVTTNKTFVNVAENHNIAFRQVSPWSRYFKVVSADDWILPQCLSTMVHFAVARPSVGILCCHQQSGNWVRWAELPVSVTVLPGREACRMALLKGAWVFGAPTAFLYRSDLLRLGKPFFPNARPHADTSACYEFLEYCDYGVVHEVLSVERVHHQQVSFEIEQLGAGGLAYLEVVLQYGPRYLTNAEFRARTAEVLDGYYRGLGACILKLKGREFWNFHRTRLREIGLELAWTKVGKAAIRRVLTEAKNPAIAMRKLLAVMKENTA